MTQEEKQLLFKDLSARLPYHVRCKIWLKYRVTEEGSLDLEHNYGDVLKHAFYYNDIKEIKPYLRPMESLTDEEEEEYEEVIRGSFEKQLEFYLRNHLDFRGLIPKGLALEALDGMYNK